MFRTRKKNRVLPGFGLTMGFTLFYLCSIVLIPLAGLVVKTSELSWSRFWSVIAQPRVTASYRLTFGASFAAGVFSAVFGLLLAWVLVRYRFPGRRIVDALVDLPFALPTAVSGIALTTLYAPNGVFGKQLEKLGIHAAFTPLGIMIALAFVGFPFVVRTVQPALEDLEGEFEDAAASLGANRFQIFTRVILPSIAPALITGFVMSFARAIGEYGSVIFIAGNQPMHTEITPLLIIGKLEQYDYLGATAIALSMLIVSFALIFTINWIQYRSQRRDAARNA